MNEIIVPICDTTSAAWAASQAIGLYRAESVVVHLLNVQRPLPKHVAQFFSRSDLREFHRDAGMQVLDPAIRMLDAAGIPHQDHVLIGHPAETIVEFAEERRCRRIVVDTPPRSMLSTFGLGSIASQVEHLMQAQPDRAADRRSSAH